MRTMMPRPWRRGGQARRIITLNACTPNKTQMWDLYGWYYSPPNTIRWSNTGRWEERVGLLTSIYRLQFLAPGEKLDTHSWSIMKPSWETTRARNRMKEHRSTTLTALRALLETTEQRRLENASLRPLFQHAWWHAESGIRSLLATYATDADTTAALQALLVDVQRLMVTVPSEPDDATPYPPCHHPFLHILFPTTRRAS